MTRRRPTAHASAGAAAHRRRASRGSTHLTARTAAQRATSPTTAPCRRAIRPSRSAASASGCRSTRPRTCGSASAASSCTFRAASRGDHRHAHRLASRRVAPRAAIVASGSELVRGDRNDRNGPFLASSLLRLGLDPARITVVGDDPADLEAALHEGLATTCCASRAASGRRTTTARSSCSRARPGSALRVDAELERRDRGALAPGRRAPEPAVRRLRARRPKQATLPDGALWVGLVGTAPGRRPRGRRVHRRRAAGPAARAPAALAARARDGAPAAAAGPARVAERRVLRFYGVSESAVAQALADGRRRRGRGGGDDLRA